MFYWATRILFADLGDGPFEAELVAADSGKDGGSVPDWRLTKAQKISPPISDRLHPPPSLGLSALARAGSAILKHPKDWKQKLTRFDSLDWSRSNAALWEGRAMSTGRGFQATYRYPDRKRHQEAHGSEADRGTSRNGGAIRRERNAQARAEETGRLQLSGRLAWQRPLRPSGRNSRAYLADAVPWVIGYAVGRTRAPCSSSSGWPCELPPEQRKKPIHIVSTDTLVEQPMSHLGLSPPLTGCGLLPRAGDADPPAQADARDPNYVLGEPDRQGLSGAEQKFRWCTERLKIKPSNKFIRGSCRSTARPSSSLARGRPKASAVINYREACRARVRERLVPNASLPNSLVYTPIEDWNNDDVWLFLMQVKNPWGHDNKSLLGMYQGATEGGECPLVVDSSTPSCGSSRFGCWVCTVVDKDRSMEAMIKNDEEKVWMTPLLELRNELGEPDRDKRDFRRMNGRVQLFHDSTIPGPYTKEAREYWLRRVLEAQPSVRNEAAGFSRAPTDQPGGTERDPPASGSTRSAGSSTASRRSTRR